MTCVKFSPIDRVLLFSFLLVFYIGASDYFPPLYLGIMDGHLPTCQAPSLVKDDLCSKYSDPIQSCAARMAPAYPPGSSIKEDDPV
ncbi:hypothetical protein CPB84DRAFT_1797785 [Gymnopilus junonius]|uniref:Uncharacterized protein n=1 Tax=Gymnopilus junonius TaxID=109634 RepID=A0A9P5TGB0_GYMJU|nr:hypothetical protein CPB84DRAFT_1797785 [Gymnopilus junonius]